MIRTYRRKFSRQIEEVAHQGGFGEGAERQLQQERCGLRNGLCPASAGLTGVPISFQQDHIVRSEPLGFLQHAAGGQPVGLKIPVDHGLACSCERGPASDGPNEKISVFAF